jgi:hypothetical protein
MANASEKMASHSGPGLRPRARVRAGAIVAAAACSFAACGAGAADAIVPTGRGSIQSFVPKGYAVIAEAKADFNGDGIGDRALVIANRADPEAPRPLLLLFGEANGGFVLAARSDKAIPEAASGGAAYPDGFDGLKAERNTLLIRQEGGSSVRTSSSWRFRFQDNGWFLIGETIDTSGLNVTCPDRAAPASLQCTGYRVDTNFLTGNQIITSAYVDLVSEKDVERLLRRKAHVKPVPLADFEPRYWSDLPR